MSNIALSSGDHQGDMVPTAASPNGAGGVPSVHLKAGGSLYSPSGGFRLTFLPGRRRRLTVRRRHPSAMAERKTPKPHPNELANNLDR
jgi:hypothetical protein